MITGIIGLLILGLSIPFIAALIKIDSRGPIFFRQIRLGINGTEFCVVKFRTMIDDAENGVGAVWASEDDSRITRIGRLLRNTYIDELPQWWNVIRGDMSAVGPRPERPALAEKITSKYPEFQHRLSAKPGISGLAQVKYKYVSSISGSRNKMTYDKIYIERASFTLDMWVVLLTFQRMIRSRGT